MPPSFLLNFIGEQIMLRCNIVDLPFIPARDLEKIMEVDPFSGVFSVRTSSYDMEDKEIFRLIWNRVKLYLIISAVKGLDPIVFRPTPNTITGLELAIKCIDKITESLALGIEVIFEFPDPENVEHSYKMG